MEHRTGNAAASVRGAERAARGERPLIRALGLFGVAAFVYLTIAGRFVLDFHQTDCPHHVLMADALLHGQLAIRPEALHATAERLKRQLLEECAVYEEETGRPFPAAQRRLRLETAVLHATRADWATYEGRVYGYWAPLTPVLTAPFVAVLGLGLSDQLLSAFLGAINVALFYLVLVRFDRVKLLVTTPACRTGLALLLAFGTAHFWLSCNGRVWFAVHICTLFALLLALLAASSARQTVWTCLLTGMGFGAAVLGRNIIVLTGLFFVLVIWMRARADDGARGRTAEPGDARARRSRAEPALFPAAPAVRKFAAQVTAFALPVLAAIGVQAAYNYARFDDPFESGLTVQVRTGGGERFRADYERTGTFGLEYLPRNAFHYFLNWRLKRLDDGRLWHDEQGNSLFLVSPAMLYLLLVGWRRGRLLVPLLAGCVPLVVALLFYFATGAVQFGPRYLTDCMPLLLMLLAIGMNGRLTFVGFALVVISIAIHIFGTLRLCPTEVQAVAGLLPPWCLPLAAGLALLWPLVRPRTLDSAVGGPLPGRSAE